ncbi:interleukin 4/13 [Scomber scombrus]|uniref:Interleukin 4/13 n=1 Tax=Scomber scombrus TaxID=13677 RepID=A0AAV1NDK8_SCOSC
MMMMLLLISAVALLVSPAAVQPNHRPENNLNPIIDLVEKYNESVSKELFVEDVSHLAGGSGKCRDKFFCKVREILHSRKREEEEVKIVRNLDVYIKEQNFKCGEVLNGMNSTGITIPLPKLLDHLAQCSRHRNLLGADTSSQ